MIWHHLITGPLIETCEWVCESGWEIDSLLETAGGPTGRLHVSEVISRAAATQGLVLPGTDELLLYRASLTAAPVTLRTSGIVLTTPDRRVAWPIGDGRTIESTGASLAILTNPDTRRYSDAYRLPGISAA